MFTVPKTSGLWLLGLWSSYANVFVSFVIKYCASLKLWIVLSSQGQNLFVQFRNSMMMLQCLFPFQSCSLILTVDMFLQVRNGHIKRITDNDIQSLVLEIVGTNVRYVSCCYMWQEAGMNYVGSMPQVLEFVSWILLGFSLCGYVGNSVGWGSTFGFHFAFPGSIP